jgi:hypothetical protein
MLQTKFLFCKQPCSAIRNEAPNLDPDLDLDLDLLVQDCQTQRSMVMKQWWNDDLHRKTKQTRRKVAPCSLRCHEYHVTRY